jgi:predicted dehydrogenase/threonine dehydrogenase-like Zn-dependent dehydrogenase
MKQLIQNMKTGETSVVDVPIPVPGRKMALVRTAASLVSVGTERMVLEFAEKSLVGKARSRPDLVNQVIDKARREGLMTAVDAVFNRLDQPIALGYSSAGTITAIGDGLQGYKVGDRVACGGGGYAVHAEYAVVPQNLLVHLPDEVEFEAAAFATLGAVALHGFRLAGLQIGEHVCVIGLGLLGLLSASIARAAGCQVFGIDLNPSRVALAEGIGVEGVIREKAEDTALSFTKGHGFDAVLICADTSSNDPVILAGTIAREQAIVVAIGAVGTEVPRRIYYAKELTFINSRSYGPGRYDPVYEEGGVDYPRGYVRWTEGRNIEAFVNMLKDGSLDVAPLITHRFNINEAEKAYSLITDKKTDPFLGVLLTYPDAQGRKQEQYDFHSKRGSEHKLLATSRVGLGVIGAGNFARAVMLPSLKKIRAVDLIGIVSGSGLSSAHAAGKFDFRYAADSIDQLLDDPEVNTLAILTRHNLHAEQVLMGLKAGKNIFVEKPLAINREQLAEIKIELLEGGPLLTVGFNRRFAPLAVELKRFLSNCHEPLIVNYRVNAGSLPLSHWLHDPDIGGGRIVGEGCHFIDFLAFIVGEPPVDVTVQGLPDSGEYREDNIIMVFSFPDGSIGSVSYFANGDKSFPKERVEISCAGRAAVLDDFRVLELFRNGRRQVFRSYFRQDKGHKAEWEAFSKVITTGGDPPIPYPHLFGVMEGAFSAVDALHLR